MLVSVVPMHQILVVNRVLPLGTCMVVHGNMKSSPQGEEFCVNFSSGTYGF